MRPTFEYDELTACVSSAQMEATYNVVQIVACVANMRMVIADAVVVDRNASDDVFQFLLLDVTGEPILDVDGQYIIGG